MSGRSWPAALAVSALSVAFCAGCVGVVPTLGDSYGLTAPSVAAVTGSPGGAFAAGEIAAAEPDFAAPVQRALPGLIQSIHANGVVWLGYNAANAQAGDINDYDGGEGWTCGVAFGNGEDVKRFVEIVFVESADHEFRDTTGSTLGDATQTQFYLGSRRYLLPVTGKRSRAAPFVTGGLVWNNLSITWDGVPTGTAFSSVYGMGFYAGTGIELYLGAQLALCMDIRASYWNWEGIPVDTGYQGNAGGNLLLVYHF